jgi:hypothetical protein
MGAKPVDCLGLELAHQDNALARMNGDPVAGQGADLGDGEVKLEWLHYVWVSRFTLGTAET